MKYTVGQILYVILKKETRIYPMQVVEEITKKTLNGETTSYMVRAGNDPKAQILISDIEGEIFESADKAKEVLIERATTNIARLVNNAVQKAQEWYPGSFEAPSDDPLTLLKKQQAQTPITPETETSKTSTTGHKKRPLAELAAELQQESDRIADNVPIVTLPDGTQAKVKSVKLPDVLG